MESSMGYCCFMCSKKFLLGFKVLRTKDFVCRECAVLLPSGEKIKVVDW